MCRLVSLHKLHNLSPTYVHPVSKGLKVSGWRLNSTTTRSTPARLCEFKHVVGRLPMDLKLELFIYHDVAWPRHTL